MATASQGGGGRWAACVGLGLGAGATSAGAGYAQRHRLPGLKRRGKAAALRAYRRLPAQLRPAARRAGEWAVRTFRYGGEPWALAGWAGDGGGDPALPEAPPAWEQVDLHRAQATDLVYAMETAKRRALGPSHAPDGVHAVCGPQLAAAWEEESRELREQGRLVFFDILDLRVRRVRQVEPRRGELGRAVVHVAEGDLRLEADGPRRPRYRAKYEAVCKRAWDNGPGQLPTGATQRKGRDDDDDANEGDAPGAPCTWKVASYLPLSPVPASVIDDDASP